MYFDAPFDPPDAPDVPDAVVELRPSLTLQQDEFMLLCRDYVERNGPLDGNTYVERLGLERKKLTKKTRKRLRLLTVYSSLYGLSFIPAPPGEQQENWRLVLADPPEPPTTTVYTGVVARFGVPHHQTSSRNLLAFVKLDGTENEVLLDVRWSRSVRLGDRVAFRVVPDVNATCRRCEKSYKAIDVRILKDADAGRADAMDAIGAIDALAPVAPDADAGPARDETLIETFRLAPTQLRLLPVTDEARGFCADVAAKAKHRGLRCEVDPVHHLNKQIQRADQRHVPIICVVGEQEASSGKLSVRARGRGDLGKIDVDVLLDMLGGVEDVDQLDAGAFEKPAASEASARPLPTLLRLDADFCLELARELLRSEL